MTRRGVSNPVIVVASLLGLFVIGGILWALVGHRFVEAPATPTPAPASTPVAVATPVPSPSPAAPAPPPAKLVGRWVEATNPDVVVVVELDGPGVKVLEPADLAGNYKLSGRFYENGARKLELTDSGELVLTTEEKPGESETRLFSAAGTPTAEATETPTETATPTETPVATETPVEETPTPADTPSAPPPTPSPVGADGTPEASLAKYYEFINGDQFEEAYQLRSLRSRQSTSYPDFTHIWSNNKTIMMLDAVTTLVDDTHADLKIHLRAEDFNTRAHKMETTVYDGTVKMVLEDEEWRYDGGDFKANPGR